MLRWGHPVDRDFIDLAAYLAGEASDAIVLYSFDCGNGAGGAQTTAIRNCSYNGGGVFTASVTVRDSFGAENRATAVVTVTQVSSGGRFGGGSLGALLLLPLALAGFRRRRPG